jgi:hypothetical protein
MGKEGGLRWVLLQGQWTAWLSCVLAEPQKWVLALEAFDRQSATKVIGKNPGSSSLVQICGAHKGSLTTQMCAFFLPGKDSDLILQRRSALLTISNVDQIRQKKQST